jgi:hypothetical protein
MVGAGRAHFRYDDLCRLVCDRSAAPAGSHPRLDAVSGRGVRAPDRSSHHRPLTDRVGEGPRFLICDRDQKWSTVLGGRRCSPAFLCRWSSQLLLPRSVAAIVARNRSPSFRTLRGHDSLHRKRKGTRTDHLRSVLPTRRPRPRQTRPLARIETALHEARVEGICQHPHQLTNSSKTVWLSRAPFEGFDGGRRWWAHLRLTRRNIKPTFPKQDIEELMELLKSASFSGGF